MKFCLLDTQVISCGGGRPYKTTSDQANIHIDFYVGEEDTLQAPLLRKELLNVDYPLGERKTLLGEMYPIPTHQCYSEYLYTNLPINYTA